MAVCPGLEAVLALVGNERSFAGAPVGLGGVHQGIEGGAVVVLLQVAEFMDDDVGDVCWRVLDESGAEGDDAASAAIAPAAAHPAVAQRRHGSDPRAMRQGGGDESRDVRQALRVVEGAEAGGKGSFIRRGGGEGIAGNLDTGTGTRAQGEAVSGAEQVLGTTVGVGCGRLVFLRLGVGGNPGEVVMDELFDVGRPAARRVREVEGAAPVHAEAQAAVVAAWRAQVDAVGVVLAGDIEGVHERCGLWCIRKKESALNRDAGASPGGVVAGFCR